MFNLTRRALLSLLPSLPFVSMFVKAPRPEPLTDLDIPFDIDTYASPSLLKVHKVELRDGLSLCYVSTSDDAPAVPCWLEGIESLDYFGQRVDEVFHYLRSKDEFCSSNGWSVNHFYGDVLAKSLLIDTGDDTKQGVFWFCKRNKGDGWYSMESRSLSRYPTVLLRDDVEQLALALSEFQEHLAKLPMEKRNVRNLQMLQRPYMVGEGD